MRKALIVAGALCVAFVSVDADAGSILPITTLPSWNGTSSVAAFGEPDTATYGQTFTAATSVLLDFTFYVDDFLNPDVVNFRAYVMGWNGSMATGPVLFSTGPLATTNNGGAGGFEAITINTGQLGLTQGNQYVAFFSASGLFNGITGLADFGFIRSDAYAGGNFVFLNNGNNFPLVSTDAWSSLGADDLAFTADFQTPEPTTLVLLGLGLAGLGYQLRRRKS